MAMARTLVLLAAVLMVLISDGLVEAQDSTPAPTTPSRSVEWRRFDVALDLRPDGLLHVTEREEVEFVGGPFTTGFANIPLRNVEGIERVEIGEVGADGRVTSYSHVDSRHADGTLGTFSVVKTADEVQIDW
jgi:hypothetical protein